MAEIVKVNNDIAIPETQKPETDVAVEMIKVLLGKGGSPVDMLDAVAKFNGMVACGLGFAVDIKGFKPRRKAFQIQQDIAKLTRRSIEQQPDEALEELSYQTMFENKH